MPKNPRGQKQHSTQEGEYRIKGDADEAEWEGDQPYEWPENQYEQCQWPADNP